MLDESNVVESEMTVEQVAPSRLYVVVDGSMPASTFAPQAVHAVTEFALARPEALRDWHATGNVCIVLEAQDGTALEILAAVGGVWEMTPYCFFEEDWAGGTPSAVVFPPHPRVQELLKDLPTAKPRGFWGERQRKRTLRKRWARPAL